MVSGGDNVTVNCVPIREIFFDPVGEFRILACKPLDNKDEIKLNNYGNFTISGYNLVSFKLDIPIIIEIEAKENAKYEGEYNCLGYGGFRIEENGNITIPQKQEESILLQFMSSSQVKNVLDAYPNFVEMVLNGHEDEFDIKKIFNVGKVRIVEYVEKIKKNCDVIFFDKDCWELGITNDADIEKVKKKYNKVDTFVERFKESPYETLCDSLEFSFSKADPIVLHNFPEYEDSRERCKYFCIDMLRVVENQGDTRINPNVIANYLKSEMPVLFPYVVDVIKNDEAFYYDKVKKYCSLKSTYRKEENIANHIKYRIKMNETAGECDKDFIERFRTIGDMSLTDEQMRILELMDKGWIAVLTGFPGSGKTQSTKALIRMLEAKNKSYTLLAPTGVASKMLSQSTGRRASTIHMLLASNALVGEYVIVDELSMVAVKLLSALFDYIGKNRKIVFVCDENQLPSIGAGNIVHDIIHSGKVPVANLTKIFRYNSSGIITNVTDVRNGNFDHADVSYNDFNYVEATSDIKVQLLDEYKKYIDMGYKKDEILILSPFRVSKFGSHAINNIIQAEYNHNPETEAKIKVDGFNICFKVGDRVINTKNNRHVPKWDIEKDTYEYCINGENEYLDEMAVYNGDLGNILAIKTTQEGLIRIIVEWDEGIGCIEGKNIKNLLLGYCISIHRAQGAQSKCIIAVINKKGKDGFINRNILYVALSRAQEQLSIIANREIIEEGLEYQANLTRETWLEEMLNE